MRTDEQRFLDAALDAVGRGWHVFPVRRGSKKPPALHGSGSFCPRTGICRDGHEGWEQRALSDPDEVRWYWTSDRYRGCNIGVATGPSGLVVVDLDCPKSADDVPPEGCNHRGVRDGAEHFAAICADHGQSVPDTCSSRTASGGTHLWFAAPPDVELHNTSGDRGAGLGWRIDTRAWGGYVVAPGSTTTAGVYRFTADMPPIPLPEWLTRALTPKPVVHTSAPPPRSSARLAAYTASAVRGERDRVLAAAPGTHSTTLYSAAGNLGQHVGGGSLSWDDAFAELYAAARANMLTADCRCTEHDIRRQITNGLRAGQQRPRIPPGQHRAG